MTVTMESSTQRKTGKGGGVIKKEEEIYLFSGGNSDGSLGHFLRASQIRQGTDITQRTVTPTTIEKKYLQIRQERKKVNTSERR